MRTRLSTKNNLHSNLTWHKNIPLKMEQTSLKITGRAYLQT